MRKEVCKSARFALTQSLGPGKGLARLLGGVEYFYENLYKVSLGFVRFEKTPVEWQRNPLSTDTAKYYRIEIRMRFWDKEGKRYSVSEPVDIGPKGELGFK